MCGFVGFVFRCFIFIDSSKSVSVEHYHELVTLYGKLNAMEIEYIENQLQKQFDLYQKQLRTQLYPVTPLNTKL